MEFEFDSMRPRHKPLEDMVESLTHDDHITITKGGIPVAVIVTFDNYEILNDLIKAGDSGS